MRRQAWSLLFLALSAAAIGCGAEEKLQVPDLDALPVGLVVTHEPNLVLAHRNGRSGDAYTWEYSTTIKTAGAPVTIEQFGAFAWVDDHWEFRDPSGEPYPASKFAEWYRCSGGYIEPGKSYTCQRNWSGADELRSYRCKWYFVGVDERGRRVKGEAIVEELPRLKN